MSRNDARAYAAPGVKKGDAVADPISMEGLALLRDTMATWYYLMMETYGRSTREEALAGSTPVINKQQIIRYSIFTGLGAP